MSESSDFAEEKPSPGRWDSARRRLRRPPGGLGPALDFLSDWALLAFAAWTLLAYLGMVAGIHVSVLLPIWIAASLVAGLLLLRLGGPGRARVAGPFAGNPLSVWARPRRPLAVAGLVGAVVFALLASNGPAGGWFAVWMVAAVCVLITAFAAASSGEAQATPVAPTPIAGDFFAAGIGLVLAAISLFLDRPSADDVFYLNRAVATAQLNHIPVKDVIVTREQVAPASGVGLPVDSFSALQGSLARFFDVQAGSVVYYVTPPLFTFLATWALWRLLRSWAPRWAGVCFVLGCAYWLTSAQFPMSPGSFFLVKMWQGKVVFVAWLVPTLYVYLTRWAGGRDARTATLLIVAGIASLGMTGSATFVAPLVFAAGAIALLLRRDWGALPIVSAAAAFPFLVGFAVTRLYPLSEKLGATGHQEPSWYFHNIFGVGVVAAMGALALVAAPWLVRSEPALRLAIGIGIVAVLLVAPGVLPSLRDLAGVSGALRRTLWVVPLPALVGLLAAIPVGAWVRMRWAAVLPAVAGLVLLGAFGNPLWDSIDGRSSFLTRHPRWKTPEQPLERARAILTRYRGDGPILAEGPIMASISLVTADPKAVNPRRWYVSLTGESARRKRERMALTRFVTGPEPRPTVAVAGRALADLRVDLVCVQTSKVALIREVQAAGPYGPAFTAGGETCLRRKSES